MTVTTPVPDLDGARRVLVPGPDLEARIRDHLASRLGGVLPPRADRGLDWYYDWVVAGDRAAEALRTLLRYSLEPGGGTLVDVGSGLGSVVLLANACGIPAVGVEPDAAEVALSRERAAEGLAGCGSVFAVGSGEALPLASGTAAAVLLYDVLEHTPRWQAVLRECRRVLAPGGLLYVKGPAYGWRFFEPHYRLPWAPLLPPALARRYVRLLGRDARYLREIVFVRRRAVLREMEALGLLLTFPRRDRVADPGSVNRAWARRAVAAARRIPAGRHVAAALAEGPLQATIDVVARRGAA